MFPGNVDGGASASDSRTKPGNLSIDKLNCRSIHQPQRRWRRTFVRSSSFHSNQRPPSALQSLGSAEQLEARKPLRVLRCRRRRGRLSIHQRDSHSFKCPFAGLVNVRVVLIGLQMHPPPLMDASAAPKRMPTDGRTGTRTVAGLSIGDCYTSIVAQTD